MRLTKRDGTMQKESKTTEKIVKVYDDRNRCIGWICEKCGTHSSFLNHLKHFQGCFAKEESND